MGHGRVFGIGLNKTGTRSVAAAMRLLGRRTLHKGDAATSRLVDEAAERGEPLLGRVGDDYDAYFDVDGLVTRFAELDRDYPGSRFVLTTRDMEGWLDSRERHVLANQQRARTGDYGGAWLSVDRRAWVRERVEHHRRVLAHFEGRPDALLVLDVTAGEGWERLAPFLGVDEPAVPFPWENRDGTGTYAPRRLPDRLRVQRRRVSWALRRLRG